jgi:thiol-disulfide isomerase/thioredoxin
MKRWVRIGIIAAVVIGVIVALAYNALSSNNANLIPYAGQPVGQAQMAALYSAANNATLAQKVGVGAVGVYPVKVSGQPIVQNGKPTVLYIGAEYCPFCASARWGLVLALMRFGNLTNLEYMTSSATDYAPSTPTFSFANAIYSSKYINFISVETETNTDTPLQSPTAWENTTFYKYDVPTASCSSGGCIPFIDFNNNTVQLGASFSPQLINSYSWAQIIAQLNNPNSTIALAVIGNANIFTAQICKITGFTPSVCHASYIAQLLNLS